MKLLKLFTFGTIAAVVGMLTLTAFGVTDLISSGALLDRAP